MWWRSCGDPEAAPEGVAERRLLGFRGLPEGVFTWPRIFVRSKSSVCNSDPTNRKIFTVVDIAAGQRGARLSCFLTNST